MDDIKQLSKKSKHVNSANNHVNIPSNYLCTICTILLTKAYQTPCGCFYCDSCVKTCFPSTDPRPCTANSEFCTNVPLILNTHVKPDRGKEREVTALKVTCPHSPCLVVDSVKNMLANHLPSCPHKPILCPQGCSSQIARNLLEQHLATCSNRRVRCDLCQLEVPAANVDSIHKDLKSPFDLCCPQIRGVCPYCGEGDYTRETIAIHLKNHCHNHTIPCPFVIAGCKFISNRADLEKHLLNVDVNKDHLMWLATLIDNTMKNHRHIEAQVTASRQILYSNVSNQSTIYRIQHDLSNLLDHVRTTTNPAMPSILPNTISSNRNLTQIQYISRICEDEFVWKIVGYDHQRTVAVDATTRRERTYIESDVVYLRTNEPSYAFKFRVYLNGSGPTAEGNYISVLYQIVAGEWDDLLTWPCTQKVTISLIKNWPITSASRRPTVALRPSGSLAVAQRPSSGGASEPAGELTFVSIREADQFVLEDNLYVYIKVTP